MVPDIIDALRIAIPTNRQWLDYRRQVASGLGSTTVDPALRQRAALAAAFLERCRSEVERGRLLGGPL